MSGRERATTEPVVATPLDRTASQGSAGATQRLRGAYYTPHSAAEFMADWVVRHDGEHILEPSFGDGIFLRAVAASAERRGNAGVRLSGIELDEEARARALGAGLITDTDARLADFLAVNPFPVQAVIGNPPYVRLRHLTAEQRDRALAAAATVLGQGMDPSGSLWLPFVLHALQFLDVGGRLAFVLPYEFTYVRYARPLWEALGERFGSLRVLRTHERLFPDLMQDVVILLADGYGSHTDFVRYQAFGRVADLLEARPVVDESIPIADLLRGERAFIGALLGDELRGLLKTRIAAATVPARELVTFNIGYVTGDKTFFHPTDMVVDAYQLPASSLRSAVTATRSIRGGGLCTSSLDADQRSNVFLPDAKALSAGEQRYIRWGEKNGVANRYKCRVRKPWFITPDTRIPDVILSVFSERPLLMVNDARFLASNSLLCGFLRAEVVGETLAAGWYTSLTLLQCEMEVHALGGGVMVLVPREAGNVRLPGRVRPRADHLSHLDRLLRGGLVAEAYRAGDGRVLNEQLGIDEREVDLIRHGVEVLAYWRTSGRSPLG